MKIFFSVGEPSGDLHGANLIRALRARAPGAEFVGYGGPKMAAAGASLHADLTELAVMWIAEALWNFGKFCHLLRKADRYFREERPDAVILVDYPGFNWWIARRAKLHGIPVFYYAPPQIWAWASWRVRKMRAFVDHVLCSLPFEEKWFRDHGVNATFIGHPYFDEVAGHNLDRAFIQSVRAEPGPLVTILPGSRTQEVTQNLKWFLKATELIRRQQPNVRFAIASFKQHQAEYAQSLLGGSDLPVEVHVGRTPELIHAADCCMAVSGSVSLELLCHTKPTVILYHVTPFAYRVQARFRKVKYITLVNLLTADDLFPKDITPYDPRQPGAEKVLFPEYLTCEDRTRDIAAHVIDWLADDALRGSRVAELSALKERVAHGGASNRAADYILSALPATRAPLAPPHFHLRPAAAEASALRRRAS